MPVRIRIVLSALIVNHASDTAGFGEWSVPGSSGIAGSVAAFAPFASSAPTNERPTTIAPAPLTNFARVSVAPKTSIVLASVTFISRSLRDRLGGDLDRLDHRRVRPAPAQVAVERLLDLR